MPSLLPKQEKQLILRKWPKYAPEDIYANTTHTTCDPQEFFRQLPNYVHHLFTGSANLIADQSGTKMECDIRCAAKSSNNNGSNKMSLMDYKFEVELFESSLYEYKADKNNHGQYNDNKYHHYDYSSNSVYDNYLEDMHAHSTRFRKNIEKEVYVVRIQCLQV